MKEQENKKTFSFKIECPACRNKTKVVMEDTFNKYGERTTKQIRGPRYFKVARWQKYDKCYKLLMTWFCNHCGYLAKKTSEHEQL